MKKYFAFLFSFLFILVSVFSFSFFGSVHAQEFSKTIQFTKFPFTFDTKQGDDIRHSSFSASSPSVRYSLSLYSDKLTIVFFASNPFTITETYSFNDDGVKKSYNIKNVVKKENLYVSIKNYQKSDLVNPSLESLNGKTVSIIA